MRYGIWIKWFCRRRGITESAAAENGNGRKRRWMIERPGKAVDLDSGYVCILKNKSAAFSGPVFAYGGSSF